MGAVVFGDALRAARMQRGLSVGDVAASLRVRDDIVQHIENSNVNAMPPEQFSTNIIFAYAQLLRLNARDITDNYVAVLRQTLPLSSNATYGSGFPQSSSSAPASSSARRDTAYQSAGASSQSGAFPRSGSYAPTGTGYAPNQTPLPATRMSYRTQASSGTRRQVSAEPVNVSQSVKLQEAAYNGTRPGQKAPTAARQQSSSGAAGLLSGNALFVKILLGFGFIVAIVLIIVLAKSFFVPDSDPGNTSGGTVSGRDVVEEDTSGKNTDLPIEPTAAVFTWQVTGEYAYLEIERDDAVGSRVPELSGTFEKGERKTYDVTGKLKIYSDTPNAITLTLNGEEVHFIDEGTVDPTLGTGWWYTYTVDFDTFIVEWREKNLTE